jgi:predicted ATP-dependent endonuclease of OLD family
LLVDEAENHLHYEAQADLLRVFERQSAAQSVLYTTHSIGCLPEDLGSAIRVVAPSGAKSSVLNSFWSGNAVGLTPMMLAMGANALAFTPARYAVIGEGRSDAILLPTLLREAREGDPYDRLGFQVVPGVAEVHSDDAADLEHEAGNVVYLIDSDEGGLAHADALSEKAREEGRVVELGDGKKAGLCLEDLVRGELLVAAFNRVLSRTRSEYDGGTLQESELPEIERSLFLENWCKSKAVPPLSKPFIAQEVVDIGRDRNESLLSDTYRQLTQGLYRRLRDALGLKDEDEDLV